jgi:hypothetical protein
MKLHFLLFLLVPTGLLAQISVGTTTPHSSAKLQVEASDKGFLPPRVVLTAKNVASPITSPATGLLVFNTATSGTSPNDVTPGFYYWDGSNWQRIINQQPDETVTFDGADPNSGSNFSGLTQSTNFIYVSNTDASQWIWNPSANPAAYVTYTPPANTAWYTKNSTTTDAGATKTGNIYRTGNVGIGTGSMDPATKLHIVSSTVGSGFRLVDGSQGANKVLQSDANGSASWSTNVAITPAVTAVLSSTRGPVGENSSTGTYIDLPNGKWSVQVTLLAQVSSTAFTGLYFVRFFFSEVTDNSSLTTDVIGPDLISGLVRGAIGSETILNMVTGTIIINNTSGATKRYYLRTSSFFKFDGGSLSVTFGNLGSNANGENSIVAYPMN